MPSLENLPNDAYLAILEFVSLQTIYRLRRVSRTLNAIISNNKQLWILILRNLVLSRGIHLIPYRKHSLQTTANDVENWLRHALTLESDIDNHLVHDFQAFDVGLDITWIKLIRGEWILFGVADWNTACPSFSLQLWRITQDSEVPKRSFTVLSLAGPVINGVVDDDRSNITIAVSIDSNTPIIQLVHLVCDDGVSRLVLDKKNIVSASHVRFLRGSLIGFAVKDGDDSFPCVSDWSTGRQWRLNLRSQNNNIFDRKRGPCIAMTSWYDHVVVILPHSVQVFPISAKKETLGNDSTASYAIADDTRVSEAIFICPEGSPAFLHVFMRYSTGALCLGTLTFEDLQPYWKCAVILAPSEEDPFIAVRLCPSLTGRYCMWIEANPDNQGGLMRLAVLKLDPPASRGGMLTPGALRLFGSPFNTPKFFQMPICDFDDARGVLVTANSTNACFVTHFTSRDVLRPAALLHGLSPHQATTQDASWAHCSSNIFTDIPDRYFQPKISISKLSTVSYRSTFQKWVAKVPQHPPCQYWSHDWQRADALARWTWLTTGPARLGLHDTRFVSDERLSVASLQRRINTLGDLVPIAYVIANSKYLLCSVGQRPFVITYANKQANSAVIKLVKMPLDELLGSSNTMRALAEGRGPVEVWEFDEDAGDKLFLQYARSIQAF